MKVSNQVANATFVLFYKKSVKLLQCTASKLAQKHKIEELEVPPIIQTLCGKNLIFKIKLDDFNLKDGKKKTIVCLKFSTLMKNWKINSNSSSLNRYHLFCMSCLPLLIIKIAISIDVFLNKILFVSTGNWAKQPQVFWRKSKCWRTFCNSYNKRNYNL